MDSIKKSNKFFSNIKNLDKKISDKLKSDIMHYKEKILKKKENTYLQIILIT